MTQAQKTGRCPFCGAALPPRTIHDRYGVPTGRGYATSCPECGKANVPIRGKAAILIGVFAYTSALLVLWHFAGLTVFALTLLATLVLAFIPLFVYVLRAGQYFNALCFLVGVGIFGVVVLRSLGSTSAGDSSYAVRVSGTVPVKQRVGRPVSASLVILNKGSTLNDVEVDFPGDSVLSTRAGDSIATWRLDGISVNGHDLPLSDSVNYAAGGLSAGGAMRVVLRLTPRLSGARRLRVEIDGYDSSDSLQTSPIVTLRSLIAGR